MKHVLFIIALLVAFGARAQNASLIDYTGKYNFGEGSQVTGVDGIITNYPDIALKLLNKRK